MICGIFYWLWGSYLWYVFIVKVFKKLKMADWSEIELLNVCVRNFWCIVSRFLSYFGSYTSFLWKFTLFINRFQADCCNAVTFKHFVWHAYFMSLKHGIIFNLSLTYKNLQHHDKLKNLFSWIAGYNINIWRLTQLSLFFMTLLLKQSNYWIMVVFGNCFSFSLLNGSLNYEKKLQQMKQLHLTLFFF